MTIETLFKNLKKTVSYQEHENSYFYEELGKKIVFTTDYYSIFYR